MDLFDHPLLFSAPIACALGLSKSIILCQLHYWLKKSNHQHDGRRWVYNTYEQWQTLLPFMSDITIRRSFHELRAKKLILVRSDLNKMKIDRTLWYSIDYEKVDAMCSAWTHANVQVEHIHAVKLTKPITIDYTEKSSKKAGYAKDTPMKISKGTSAEEIASLLVKEKGKEPPITP